MYILHILPFAYTGLLCLLNDVTCWSDTDVKHLTTELFVTRQYDKLISPIDDFGHQMDIYIAMSLFSINEVNALGHKLVTSARLEIVWVDHKLEWDIADYNGTSRFFYRQSELWRPAIALVNGFTKLQELGNDFIEVNVHHTGYIRWTPFEVFESKCSIDIHYFPYDTQRCELRFEVWMNDDLQLWIGTSGLDINNYDPNDEWRVISTYTRQDTPTTAVFGMYLRRNPAYYMLSIVLPVVFLSLLEVFTFVLPSDGGEKMGYSVTVFLAFAVFLTIVSESLPVSSTPGLLSVYLIYLFVNGVFVITTLSILLRVNLFDDSKPIPSWIQIIVRLKKRLKCRRCNCFCRRKNTNKVKIVEVHDDTMQLNAVSRFLDEELARTNENGQNMASRDWTTSEKDEKMTVTWKCVANTMDVVLFTVSLLSVIIASVVVFMKLYNHERPIDTYVSV